MHWSCSASLFDPNSAFVGSRPIPDPTQVIDFPQFPSRSPKNFGLSGGNPEARHAIVKRYEEMVPLGRIGRPEEAAEAVLWLCSAGASYLTGHSLILDGGWTAATR